MSKAGMPPPYPGTGETNGTSTSGAYPVQTQVVGSYQQSSTVNGQTTSYSSNIVVPGPMLIQHFRETPIRMKCQFCSADVITATSYDVGTMTWLACFFVAWFCALGCCLIPFCMDGCKDVVHTCPNCQQQVGRYNRM